MTIGTNLKPTARRAIPRPGNYEASPEDWYIEPPWAVELLIEAIEFEGVIFDPCCGIGTIPDTFAAAGFETFGSDKIDRAGGAYPCEDFLLGAPAFGPCKTIVMNPPYLRAKGARLFIERAHDLASRKVAVFVNNKFLHSSGRWSFFDHELPPTQILFLSSRPSCPPGELLLAGELDQSGGSMDYVWLIYDKQNPTPVAPRWLAKPSVRDQSAFDFNKEAEQ